MTNKNVEMNKVCVVCRSGVRDSLQTFSATCLYHCSFFDERHFAMERGKAFSFHTPSSMLVVGPSGCGKTVFTTSLILDNLDLFENLEPNVHYCYGVWQDNFRPLQQVGVQFYEGIPDYTTLQNWFPKGGLLILDDLMEEGANDKQVLDLFTKHSHHNDITVLYLCQDMFPPGKYSKSISRNAHYIVAFKNPRDQVGMRNLLIQAFPSQWKTVMDRFSQVTEQPFGYLVLDLHPRSSDDRRIFSHLLKDEGCMRCYRFVRDVRT
ncbi:uncharacterized protein LOC144640413 [Oculina patagonica]